MSFEFIKFAKINLHCCSFVDSILGKRLQLVWLLQEEFFKIMSI